MTQMVYDSELCDNDFIREASSLVCADVRLNIRFSFTRDSYIGFLLRHKSFSYVIVSQKTYTQDEGSISFGRGNNLTVQTHLHL